MRQILEEMKMCLSDMVVTMHERSSVHPWEGNPVTRHEATERVLYRLFSLDAAVAGAIRHLERTNDEEMLSGQDKENHRMRIQLSFDVEFELLNKEIEFRLGQPEWWAIPVNGERLEISCHSWHPTPEDQHDMDETMEQFLLIKRALFPLNEKLRDYVWEGVG